MTRALSSLIVLSSLSWACTTGSSNGPEHGGAAATAGSSGTTGGTSGTSGASGVGGASGQAGTSAGSSGAAGVGGSAGGSGGTAGTTQPPVDAGGDAMPPMDAMVDGSTERMPLAARVCPPGPFGDPLPADGPQRTATLVQSGFGFTEGPVWLADQGVLLFSDMNFGGSAGMGPPSVIHRLTPPSSFDVFEQNGNSNGLALDLDGNVLACTHDAQTLSRYDATTAARTTLSSLNYQGKRFYSPNDLTVRSDGTVYFTDPDWQSDGRDGGIGETNVYRVTPSGTVELVSDAFDKPNGIALSPDEGTLYVGSVSSDIAAFTVHADGSVTPKGVFVSAGGGTDGFTVDCAGNLYAAGGNQVQVWSAAGVKLGDISVPKGTSNVAFGGADRKTLYITAQDSLYSIRLLVPGLPY